MNIKDTTLKNLLGAINAVGELEVEELLYKLQERDRKMIDDVVELVCSKINCNKSFLFLRYNHSDSKKDALIAIIYILKKNNVRPSDIIKYFAHKDLKVNAIYNSFFDLSDEVPYQKRLKHIIFEADKEADIIFRNYFHKNITHGNNCKQS